MYTGAGSDQRTGQRTRMQARPEATPERPRFPPLVEKLPLLGAPPCPGAPAAGATADMRLP